MSLMRFSSPLVLSLALVACDGAAPVMDAGQDGGIAIPDSGPPDAGPPLACTDRRRLDGVLGDTVSVMFDTRMTETRPRDLGLNCGNVEAELRWAPQEVVELHVPGSGPVAVELDTVFDGNTDIEFNTVLQVRRTCETVPAGFFPPSCFDDVAQNDFRSRGALMANGGDVLFVIVTGYSAPPATQGTVDRGRVRLDVTVRNNTAPTITDASFLLALNDARIAASGMDADADVRGVALNFYGPAGELLDIYGDGAATEDGDVYVVFFDPTPTGTDYAGQAVVLGSQVNLAGYLRAVGATAAGFRVFDEAWALSAPRRVDIAEATLVGFGEECDATRVCRPEMTCVAGICGATGPIGGACGGAIDLMVPAPTEGMATSITRSGTTGAGEGNFAPRECVGDANATIGAETIYRVTVPEGITADLLVTTDLPGTGMTDTILYVRGACPDSGSQLACSDDIRSGNLRSAVEVRDLAAGNYFVFVERYGGLASGSIPHELRATLRPVLASGATCDMTGTANRCATGTCTAGMCP
jgi:hypothetical protein